MLSWAAQLESGMGVLLFSMQVFAFCVSGKGLLEGYTDLLI